MKKDRFDSFDDEVRDLVLEFERTVLKGGMQFFDVDELEMIIDYYLEVGDMDPLEAAVSFAEYLYPDSIEVKIRRAHVAIARQQYKSALNQLLALHEKEPNNTDLAYSLGVVYSAMDRPDEAVDHFLAASTDGWQVGRIYGNIAEEYVKKDDLETAIHYYELALTNRDHDTSTLYNYVDTCEQHQCCEEGCGHMEEYVKRHPYSREGWFCLGLLYIDLSQVEKAIDSFEYALAIDNKSAETYAELAYAYELAGDIGHAASTLHQMTENTDSQIEAYRRLGQLYQRYGNAEASNIYYTKALAIKEDDASSMAGMAVNYIILGDFPMALLTARKAEGIEPDNADVQSALAKVYDAKGDWEKAGSYYDLLVINPQCTEQHCREYTDYLYRQKNYDIMIQFAEESLESFPNDPFYTTYLAAAYFYTNRYNRARKVLPYTVPEELAKLCPEIMEHPLLGPLVPMT